MMGIYAEAIVAHVPCHPATCDVILCTHHFSTCQHNLFVLLGIVAVMNMHAPVEPLLMCYHVVHRR